MRDDTTSGNSGLDESIQLFVSSNGQLKMPGGDTLHLEILARISSQLQDLGCEVFENGRCVDSSGCANALAVLNRKFEETMDTTDWKLQTCLGRTGLRCLL
jgi:uncharacterized SAM-dependent methyltransferase